MLTAELLLLDEQHCLMTYVCCNTILRLIMVNFYFRSWEWMEFCHELESCPCSVASQGEPSAFFLLFNLSF